jgi:predicted dehydrogenase
MAARPSTFGVVGSGWRAEFFVRLARLLPERLAVAGAVVRREEAVGEVASRWELPVYRSVEELVDRHRPEFVITSVPRTVNPDLVTRLVRTGTPVLSETPPALDLDGMLALWADVGESRLVQVAEQYLLLPGHAARREIVRRGVIGRPTSVQVSSTHDYHAVSMMRGFLGVGFGPVTASAARFTAPLVDPLRRSGWTDDDTPREAGTLLATLDFGGGASGLYDFTDNQWHNQLRLRRVLVRGSHGEIHDDTVVRLAAPRTILRSCLIRSQLGYDLNLDGFDTEHIAFDGEVVYRNALLGLRLMDEEIAIATMLLAMAAWCRGEGPPPYPLAEGCQDHHVALAMHESLSSGRPVVADEQPWASVGGS